MMKSTAIEITASDGLVLKGTEWVPEDEIQGVVALVHGLGEHIGRYAHLGGFLASKGFALVGLDNRGHGKTAGKRGHTPSYDALMETVRLTLKKASDIAQGKPVFLYGHSWGGNQALNFLLREKPAIQGGIITGPWLQLPKPPPALKVLLAKMMNGIFPSFSENNGLNPKELSHDPKVAEAYQKDPLVHSKITARTFLESEAAALWALQNASRLPFRILLMHGTHDRMTSPNGSKAFAAKAKDLVHLKLWEGFFHEIHNEPQNEAVFDELWTYIQSRL